MSLTKLTTLLLLSVVAPLQTVHAQIITGAVNLDKLFQVSENNFCYQQNQPVQQSVAKSLHIASQSVYQLGGVPVSTIQIQPTVLKINETGDHLKQTVLTDRNKYPLKDLESPIKNIYTIEHKVTIPVEMSPVKTLAFLSNRFRGLNFQSDSYAGQVILASNKTDFNQAKNIKEFNRTLEKTASSSLAFLVTGNAQQSIINYTCQITIVTSKTPEEIAQQLSDTTP